MSRIGEGDLVIRTGLDALVASSYLFRTCNFDQVVLLARNASFLDGLKFLLYHIQISVFVILQILIKTITRSRRSDSRGLASAIQ